MKKNINMVLFTPLFVISVIIPLSSSSWLMIWFGLEFNLMLFVFLCSMNNNMFSSESSMKYFLIQASGSMFLLFTFTINLGFFEEWAEIWCLLPPLAMALKSGMAPVHGWVPEVLSKFPHSCIYLFFTAQKINPLFICFSSWFNFMLLFMVLNIIVGSMGGICESSIFKMLVYSSINNMGWMIMCLIDSCTLFFIYFFVYCLINLLIMANAMNLNLKWLIQMKTETFMKKSIIFMNFFSLSGLPPLVGFFSKWLVIYSMSSYSIFFIVMAIIFSVILLFYYIKACVSSLVYSNSCKKWMVKSIFVTNSFFLIFAVFFNLIGGVLILLVI